MLIDRDAPCRRCGCLAARDLPDGIGCVRCGLVEPDRFVAAKRGGRHA